MKRDKPLDKTFMKSAALFITLVVVISGCHKPSTRLDAQIQILQNIQLKLALPQDTDPSGVSYNYTDVFPPYINQLAKGSREREVFQSACDEYDSYGVMINGDRNDLKIRAGGIYIGTSTYDSDVAAYKEEADKDNAAELREYQIVKDKAKEAEGILENIQANE